MSWIANKPPDNLNVPSFPSKSWSSFMSCEGRGCTDPVDKTSPIKCCSVENVVTCDSSLNAVVTELIFEVDRNTTFALFVEYGPVFSVPANS